MKLINRIALASIMGVALFSCSSNEEQFIGTWSTESEEEVLGLTFLLQQEKLTLNEDLSFSQCFIYFGETKYDTIATSAINGTWKINNNCLEMSYDTTGITINCDDEDIKDIFFDNLMGNVTFANDELKKAHDEGSEYGIQNAAVKDSTLISKENPEDETGEIIYTKIK